MKKTILAILIAFSTSCTEVKQKTTNLDLSTPESALKSNYTYLYNQDDYPVLDASQEYCRQHKDEILKTLEIVEKIPVTKISVLAVLYRFSIGAEIVHRSTYLKKIDNKWYFYNKYFSSYDDDPYKNNDGANGKVLVKKIEDWDKESTNVWWN